MIGKRSGEKKFCDSNGGKWLMDDGGGRSEMG
jgi:hypothetical protein